MQLGYIQSKLRPGMSISTVQPTLPTCFLFPDNAHGSTEIWR